MSESVGTVLTDSLSESNRTVPTDSVLMGDKKFFNCILSIKYDILLLNIKIRGNSSGG